MKKTLTLFIFSIAVFASALFAEPPIIRIVQPYENANIPAVDSSFVFGSVVPASSTLIINGISVKPYKNGGFLTMIPFQPGPFKIEAVANFGTEISTVIRNVTVAEAFHSFALDSGEVDVISPRSDIVLRPGDLIPLTIQAAPESTTTCHIGKIDSIPMLEQPGVKGIYKGVYRIQPDDKFDREEIFFHIKRSDGKKLIKKFGQHVTVQRRAIPRYVELLEDSILLTGPGADFGYHLFPLKGTRFEVTGEWGEYYRLCAASTMQGWIKKSALSELPAGSTSGRSTSSNIRISVTENSTLIEIPLQFRHLYRVEQFTNPPRYELTLWGVMADTDRLRFKAKSPIIKEISWRQPENEVYVLDIDTLQKDPWGYDVRYEGTTLIFEVRDKPVVGLGRNTPLKGLKVILDPGHSLQNYGTIGPKANTEASVVFAAAQVVKKELEKKGAIVVLTRDAVKEMGLKSRSDLAWKEKGNVFISLHCDATPEGQDPRPVQGFSVHYYSAQSRALAEEVYKIYGEKSSIPEQGVWRSNLSVCRTTQMPSILFELGFLVLPEYEELLLTPEFQQTIAETISTALVNTIGSAQ